MNTRLPQLLMLALVLPLTAAGAQDQPLPSVPQSLGLQEAIDLATQYSPVYRQTANDRGPAAWGVRNAFAQTFLPTFNASGGVGYSGAGSQNFLSQQFVQPSATISSNYQLSLSYTLSGRTLSQPGLARARYNAADASITGARMLLRSTIVNQYLAVLQAQSLVQLSQAQLTSSEENLRLAQARYQVGQTTVLDVRQAEVARGRAEVGLLRNQQSVTVEKLRLFQQMGVTAPDDPSVVALSDTFPVTEPEWQLPDLLAEADQRNPDLNSLKAQETAAKWNERAEKSNWLPSLSFRAGWSAFTQQFTNSEPLVQNAISSAQSSARSTAEQCDFLNSSLLNPGETPLPCPSYPLSSAVTDSIAASVRAQNSVFPFDFTRQPFQASVTVSLPIFTQFSRPLQVSQASAQAEDAREAVRSRNLQVRTDVSNAYYTLETAYKSIEIQQTNRQAAAEGLRLATERYRVGSGTFFDLLNAQVTSQQAESDYITAVYDYHRAVAALETVVGRPLR